MGKDEERATLEELLEQLKNDEDNTRLKALEELWLVEDVVPLKPILNQLINEKKGLLKEYVNLLINLVYSYDPGNLEYVKRTILLSIPSYRRDEDYDARLRRAENYASKDRIIRKFNEFLEDFLLYLRKDSDSIFFKSEEILVKEGSKLNTISDYFYYEFQNIMRYIEQISIDDNIIHLFSYILSELDSHSELRLRDLISNIPEKLRTRIDEYIDKEIELQSENNSDFKDLLNQVKDEDPIKREKAAKELRKWDDKRVKYRLKEVIILEEEMELKEMVQQLKEQYSRYSFEYLEEREPKSIDSLLELFWYEIAKGKPYAEIQKIILKLGLEERLREELVKHLTNLPYFEPADWETDFFYPKGLILLAGELKEKRAIKPMLDLKYMGRSLDKVIEETLNLFRDNEDDVLPEEAEIQLNAEEEIRHAFNAFYHHYSRLPKCYIESEMIHDTLEKLLLKHKEKSLEPLLYAITIDKKGLVTNSINYLIKNSKDQEIIRKLSSLKNHKNQAIRETATEIWNESDFDESIETTEDFPAYFSSNNKNFTTEERKILRAAESVRYKHDSIDEFTTLQVLQTDEQNRLWNNLDTAYEVLKKHIQTGKSFAVVPYIRISSYMGSWDYCEPNEVLKEVVIDSLEEHELFEILDLLEDEDHSTVRYAFYALGSIGDKRAAKVVITKIREVEDWETNWPDSPDDVGFGGEWFLDIGMFADEFFPIIMKLDAIEEFVEIFKDAPTFFISVFKELVKRHSFKEVKRFFDCLKDDPDYLIEMFGLMWYTEGFPEVLSKLKEDILNLKQTSTDENLKLEIGLLLRSVEEDKNDKIAREKRENKTHETIKEIVEDYRKISLKERPQTVEKICEYLQSDNLSEIYSALWGLNSLEPDDTAEKILPLLQHWDRFIQRDALITLERLGDKSAIEPLEKMLDVELNITTKEKVREVLNKLKEMHDEGRIEPLIKSLSASSYWFRKRAATGLCRFQDRVIVEPLLQHLLDDFSFKYDEDCPMLSLDAAKIFTSIRKLDEKRADVFVEDLIKNLSSSTDSDRFSAFLLLVTLAKEKVIEQIEPKLQNACSLEKHTENKSLMERLLRGEDVYSIYKQ